MTTKAEIKAALADRFPGVDFRVFIGSYARGTNESRSVIEISYNYKKHPVDFPIVEVIPQAKVWAVGKR